MWCGCDVSSRPGGSELTAVVNVMISKRTCLGFCLKSDDETVEIRPEPADRL